MQRLLFTNDDGIDSPGLHALADAFRASSDVTIMAPSRNCSGASQAITLDRPVAVRPHPRGFAVDGTPCDCAHLALQGAVSIPDGNQNHRTVPYYAGVISGINHGSNLGEDVMYSGTVAAAREANLAGVSSMAISLVIKPSDSELHLSSAAWYAQLLWSHYQQSDTPLPYFLNINVPNLPLSAIKGLILTRLSTRLPSKGFVSAISPRGESSFWIGQFGEPIDDFSEGLMRDHMAIKSGWVSVTPLSRLSTSPDKSKHEGAMEALNRLVYLGAEK